MIKATFPLGHRRPKSGKWLAYSGSWYRNAHFHESNNVKKRYTQKLAAPQLKNISPIEGVAFSLFVLYRPDKRDLDLDNYTTVHKKFFHDALTEFKIIKDDSVTNAPLQISVYGGIDRENPRVDVYVSNNLNEIGILARKKLCPTIHQLPTPSQE